MAKDKSNVERDVEVEVDITQRKMIGKSMGEKIFDVVNYALITLICLICLYPMLYVLFASLSNGNKLYTHVGPIWAPLQPMTLEGYRHVLSNPDILTGYFNTLIYVVAGTLFSMLLTVLGAYVLSRTDYKLKKFFTMFVVLTMYLSGGMIPTFIVVRNLGMLDTRLAIIIVGSVSTWNMIVMKTSFSAVPKGLEEAAIIDGANEIQVLTKVILPTTKATLAVIVLFYAVGIWNSWFNAMIYLQDRKLYPLQLFMREILVEDSAMEGAADIQSGIGVNYIKPLLKYCTIIVSTVPILCVYPFVQRYFVKGVMMGSLKE
ncbi:carbohydrate ABC transporter permease [Oscillospiraceae bacterium 42-9]